MRAYTRILTTLAAVVAGTALVIGQTQGYRITVSQDRLINAQNEPQNWLLMRRRTTPGAFPSANGIAPPVLDETSFGSSLLSPA